MSPVCRGHTIRFIIIPFFKNEDKHTGLFSLQKAKKEDFRKKFTPFRVLLYKEKCFREI